MGGYSCSTASGKSLDNLPSRKRSPQSVSSTPSQAMRNLITRDPARRLDVGVGPTSVTDHFTRPAWPTRRRP
jgi:hypothetical protein